MLFRSSSAGPHSITVGTDAGNVEYDNLMVGDPMPVISSITTNAANPSDFQAGATSSFTIAGSHFGTNPTLNISGPQITSNSYGISGTPTDQSISGWISAPAAGTATVTVISQGYNTNNFVQSGSDSPTSNVETVTIDPAEQAPVPTILLNQQNVTNNVNPIPVYVGQQIALTAVPLPGTPQTNQYWDPPQGSTIASYTIDSATPPQSAVVTTLPGAGNCQTLQGSCLTFYWIAAGDAGQANETVTYHYSLNGQSQAPVIVTFQVNSPTNVNIDAPQQPTSIQPGPVIWTSIDFNGAATAPAGNAGQYSWVQVVNSQQIKYLTSNQGTQNCTLPPFKPGFVGPVVPALDRQYPYPPEGLSASDIPSYALSAQSGTYQIGEQFNSASYTMILQWNPQLANSIPVPLGSVTWSYACDAANTLGNPQWVSLCPSTPSVPTKAPFTAGGAPPTWQGAIVRDEVLSCVQQ